MKVKCLFNTGKVLPKDVYKENRYDEASEFQVTINMEYIVYGITTIKKYNWFLICDDTYDGTYIYYPLYLPIHLFAIVDNQLSRYWLIKEGIDHYDNNEKILQLGFKELLEDEFFFGNLVEGYKREIKIFQDYKRLMDAE